MKPFFSGSKINRLTAQRSTNLLSNLVNCKNYYLLFDRLRPLALDGNPFYSKTDLERVFDEIKSPIFIGLESDCAYWAFDVSFKDLNINGTRHDARSFMSTLENKSASILGYARSLISWNSDQQFCSKCSQKTISKDWGHKKECISCKNIIYPRLDPVVIALVLNKTADACLLGRSRHHPPKVYTCLAGYMEPGESIEDAVIREVKEESNIQVEKIKYLTSQPWPFPHSLMIGCFATAISNEIICSDNELEHASWFSKPELIDALSKGRILVPPPFTISHALIHHWIKS